MSLRVAAIAYTHYESDPRVRREAEILAKRGDDVTVWCLRREGQAAEGFLNGVRLVRVDLPRYRGSNAGSYVASYGRFLSEVTLAVYRQHRRRKFDLVHVHTMPDFLVVAGLLPKLSGAKVVLDMHDLMPDLYALKFGLDRDGRIVSALRGLERLSVAMSDHAVCVHEPQYRLLLRDGVPAKKLSVVMNAPDPDIFAARTKQPSIKGSDGEIRMVYHGTVLHRFGVDLAVRALAEARRQNPRLRLQIIGDGDFLPDVKRLAAELRLDPPILEIIGQRLPIDEVARIVREAHIGIVPNRDDQEDSVLPNKLLEYVSIGIPVIATRTRCITHYFGEKELELVPIESVSSMASAMIRLSKDRERRRELTSAAKAWEDRYGYQTQRRAFLDVIDVVTTGRRIEEPPRPSDATKRIEAPMAFDDEDDTAATEQLESPHAVSSPESPRVEPLPEPVQPLDRPDSPIAPDLEPIQAVSPAAAPKAQTELPFAGSPVKATEPAPVPAPEAHPTKSRKTPPAQKAAQKADPNSPPPKKASKKSAAKPVGEPAKADAAKREAAKKAPRAKAQVEAPAPEPKKRPPRRAKQPPPGLGE